MTNQIAQIITDYRNGISVKDLARWYGLPVDRLRSLVLVDAPQRFDPEPTEPPRPPVDESRVGRYIRRRRGMPVHYGQLAILKRCWPDLFNEYAARHPEARGYV